MSYSPTQEGREKKCCLGHPVGSPLHKQMTYKGKPFFAKDHEKEFTQLGFTMKRDELAQEIASGAKPPGQPKKVGNVLVYPTRHFA